MQNELTFQLIVEASPNALVLVNHNGKIAYANKFAKSLFKYEQSELIGQDLALLLPSQNKSQHPDFLNSFFNNPESIQMGVNCDLFAIKKDGTEFPVEIGLNPIVTVEGTLVLAAIIDITERKKAEDQFRLVVESSPNALVLVNPEGKITLINHQTEKLFGFSRKELINNEVELLLPDRYKKNHPNLKKMFFFNPQTRSMGAGRDLFAQRKDKTEFPVEIGLNPIETSQGNMVLASIIDITERKKGEEKLKIYTSKLELKNEELEQFSYIASHDLQEPLNTVINFINLLSEDQNNQLNESSKMSFNYITQAAFRMKDLITGILDYSRIGKNSTPKLIDFNVLIKSVVDDLNSSIAKTNAKIIFNNMPQIMAFETEIRLLFQNLISNAIKFREKGKNPKVVISAVKEKSEWKFIIKDNGIGIDKKFTDKIFIIFQRLHRRDKYEGTGIGLAHCRKIVEQHNGKIWVESELGNGSTFFFTINSNLNKNEKI